MDRIRRLLKQLFHRHDWRILQAEDAACAYECTECGERHVYYGY